MMLTHDEMVRAAQHLAAGKEYTVRGNNVVIDGVAVSDADLEAAHAEAMAADQWRALRTERDRRLLKADGRVRRHDDQVALGLTPTDNLPALRQYAQDLRDLPAHTVDPANPDWPIEP